MKKFLLNTSLFFIPFIVIFTLNKLLHNQLEGDLVRIGYIYSNPSPKSLVNSQYKIPKQYTLLSEVDLKTKRKFDIITIGDSFSEQRNFSYYNYLAKKGVSVLHINRFQFLDENPMQTLIQLLNSKVFDYITADYIILQSVERTFNERIQKIDFDRSFELDSLNNLIDNYIHKSNDYDIKFFSNATLKLPITNIQYLFQSKPYYSKTYKYKSTSNNLFTNSPNDLLFFETDIKNLYIKNDSISTLNSIKTIEKIDTLVKQRKMKLIMLISPDKYDLYYKFIDKNSNANSPLFFKFYNQAKKEYINIDSYKILNEKINSIKDIYFYDDSHWSPIGAQIIADEIYGIISK